MARSTPPLLLIVDDDPAHRLMLATLLEDWGYRVEEAEDGLKALSIVQESPVDLVLMDLRMPRMDGLEATRRIRGLNPAVPVIIMTAYFSVATAVEAVNSGALVYITKPLHFDALKAAVEQGLQSSDIERNEYDQACLQGINTIAGCPSRAGPANSELTNSIDKQPGLS